jgi:transcriptional regulator GlxA family with amidase domain
MFSFHSKSQPRESSSELGWNRRINVLSAKSGRGENGRMKSPLSKTQPPHRVVMVAFDAAELLDVVGPLETFANAASLAPEPNTYTVEIAAKAIGAVRAASGLMLTATADYSAIAAADTVLIAGGAGVEAAASDLALRDALRRAALRSGRIGSVCTGAFVLAAAGLLDGRRAVTHWNFCARLAGRFPAITVESDPIFLVDRGIWTSAGVTAGIDLALAMIERDHGPKLAMRTAQELVMFRRRPGGQSQFSAELQLQATPHRPIQALQEWILENPAADLSVEALAARMHMSDRNFARVFQREAGMTPARFVEQARLQKARELLELTAQSLDAIAAACGYRSADVLARALQRRLGVAPQDYRRRFAAIWKETGADDHADAQRRH